MSDKLNADIARAKGWKPFGADYWMHPNGNDMYNAHPFYTTDPAEWGPLQEEMLEGGQEFALYIDHGLYHFQGEEEGYCGIADTLGHAVCKAWMAVKGEGAPTVSELNSQYDKGC